MHQTSMIRENSEHGLHIQTALPCFFVLGLSFTFVVKIAASFPYQFSLLWNKIAHKCTVSLIAFLRISVTLFM